MIDESAPVTRVTLGQRVLREHGDTNIPMTVVEVEDDDARHAETGELSILGVYLGRVVRLRCDDPDCSCAPDSAWHGGGWLHSAMESQLVVDLGIVAVDQKLW